MRKDYKKLMVIGSGPIVIGQAAEFDFSGSQACRSLREEGYKTVLVNSNPATIQTDPDTADKVYIEPMTSDMVAKIIEKEGVDGVISGMGGQTALNICSELAEKGYLEKLNCALVGTQPDAIEKSEDRELFKEAMEEIGEPCPKSKPANSIEEALAAVEYIGKYPVLMALSRKTCIGEVTGRDVQGRLSGTLTADILSVLRGASMIRVHDVKEAVDSLKILKEFC